mmetsp:Transcript_21711/g.35827  ORF Transcript_21711/g.35827 Transcript_21711/m.35827 type:complete len:212 (-) Transcript_21711:515-1150(-)
MWASPASGLLSASKPSSNRRVRTLSRYMSILSCSVGDCRQPSTIGSWLSGLATTISSPLSLKRRSSSAIAWSVTSAGSNVKSNCSKREPRHNCNGGGNLRPAFSSPTSSRSFFKSKSADVSPPFLVAGSSSFCSCFNSRGSFEEPLKTKVLSLSRCRINRLKRGRALGTGSTMSCGFNSRPHWLTIRPFTIMCLCPICCRAANIDGTRLSR